MKQKKKRYGYYNSIWEFVWCCILVLLVILAFGTVESMVEWFFSVWGA